MISEQRQRRLDRGYILMSEEGVLLKDAARIVQVSPERLFTELCKRHPLRGLLMLLIALVLGLKEKVCRK